MQVLVQKLQVKVLRCNNCKLASMTNEAQNDLDDLCKSTIIVSLPEHMHYNAVDENQSAWNLWKKIKNLYDKQSPTSQRQTFQVILDSSCHLDGVDLTEATVVIIAISVNNQNAFLPGKSPKPVTRSDRHGRGGVS